MSQIDRLRALCRLYNYELVEDPNLCERTDTLGTAGLQDEAQLCENRVIAVSPDVYKNALSYQVSHELAHGIIGFCDEKDVLMEQTVILARWVDSLTKDEEETMSGRLTIRYEGVQYATDQTEKISEGVKVGADTMVKDREGYLEQDLNEIFSLLPAENRSVTGVITVISEYERLKSDHLSLANTLKDANGHRVQLQQELHSARSSNKDLLHANESLTEAVNKKDEEIAVALQELHDVRNVLNATQLASYRHEDEVNGLKTELKKARDELAGKTMLLGLAETSVAQLLDTNKNLEDALKWAEQLDLKNKFRRIEEAIANQGDGGSVITAYWDIFQIVTSKEVPKVKASEIAGIGDEAEAWKAQAEAHYNDYVHAKNEIANLNKALDDAKSQHVADMGLVMDSLKKVEAERDRMKEDLVYARNANDLYQRLVKLAVSYGGHYFDANKNQASFTNFRNGGVGLCGALKFAEAMNGLGFSVTIMNSGGLYTYVEWRDGVAKPSVEWIREVKNG